MGFLITGDEWLVQLGLLGDPAALIGVRLLGMQIRTAARRGHILTFDTHDLRRKIRHAAVHGYIADAYVTCQACGWPATLLQWLSAVERDERWWEWMRDRYRQSTVRQSFFFMAMCQAEAPWQAYLDAMEAWMKGG